MRSWHDRVIERGTAAVIVLGPIVFACVPMWASSIARIAAFCIFGVWLHRQAARERISLEPGPVIALVALLAALAVVQLVPLPERILSFLSPSAAGIRSDGGACSSGSWQPLSLNPQETLDGLVGLLSGLAIFIVVSNHFHTRRRIALLVRAIIFTACILVIEAVLQKATWNGRLYWFYPIDPLYEKRLAYVWGPYLNRNHFAGLLEMAVPFAVGMVMYRLSRIRLGRRSVWKNLVTVARNHRLQELAGYFLAFVLLSGALFATLSRGGILGYGASMAGFGMLMRVRRSFRKWTGFLAVAGLTVAAVGLFASWERIEERFMRLSDEDRIARLQVWTDLSGTVKDFPIFGSGLGTFDRVFPRYQTRYATIRFEHAENEYLEVLTDMGIPGFVLVLSTVGVYYAIVLGRWRVRKNPFAVSIGAAGLASCIALSVHGLTDFNLRVSANAFIFSVVAGLTVAVIGMKRERNCAGSPSSGPPRGQVEGRREVPDGDDQGTLFAVRGAV